MRSGLRFTALQMRTAIAAAMLLFALWSGGAGHAKEQVFTIDDFDTAKENLTLRHKQAWRLYEYYRIQRENSETAQKNFEFWQQDFKDIAPGGTFAGMAVNDEGLGKKLQKYRAERQAAEDKMKTVKTFWDRNNFDIAVGVLPDDFERMITVKYEDPPKSGRFVTKKMNRIEYRLYNGKRLKIFKDPGGTAGTYVGDPKSDPQPLPMPGDIAADCGTCPAGKALVDCRDGKPICLEPGTPYIYPTEDEACVGPDCPGSKPDGGLGAGGINSLLRGD